MEKLSAPEFPDFHHSTVPALPNGRLMGFMS